MRNERRERIESKREGGEKREEREREKKRENFNIFYLVAAIPLKKSFYI